MILNDDYLNNIQSRQDLAVFLRELLKDYQQNSTNWENPELYGYLEALERFIQDLDGYFLNRGEDVPEQPTWKLFAEILLSAKYYE